MVSDDVDIMPNIGPRRDDMIRLSCKFDKEYFI